MIELEYKIETNKQEADYFNKKFKDLSEVTPQILIYKDVYFDSLDNSFTKTEKELRVRQVTNMSIGNNVTYKILTAKGGPIDEISKSKEEYETQISDFKEIRSILSLLGFKEILQFEKKITLYKIKRNTSNIEISYAFLPALKRHFFEFEILVKNKNDIAKNKRIIFDLFDELGFNKNNITSEYYTDMMINLHEKRP